MHIELNILKLFLTHTYIKSKFDIRMSSGEIYFYKKLLKFNKKAILFSPICICIIFMQIILKRSRIYTLIQRKTKHIFATFFWYFYEELYDTFRPIVWLGFQHGVLAWNWKWNRRTACHWIHRSDFETFGRSRGYCGGLWWTAHNNSCSTNPKLAVKVILLKAPLPKCKIYDQKTILVYANSSIAT